MASIHFQKKLIHSCTIQRNTPAQSSSGELIDSWANLATGVDCRYVEKREAFANEAVGFQVSKRHMLLLNSGVDVKDEDRIITILLKSDSSTVDAGPFVVDAVLERNTGSAHHISLELEKIE